MKKYIFIILIVISTNSFAQTLYDFETIDKIMYLLEKSINQDKILEKIPLFCSNNFEKSDNYSHFESFVSQFNINLGYTDEEAIKEFPIKKSKDKLVVSFIKGSKDYWYIKDAYVKQQSGEQNFESYGFKPLALEFNFVDFIDAIANKSIEKYSGLAPNGKLPLEFLRKYQLEQNSNTTLYIKNIIAYEGETIKDIYYIELTYYEKLQNKSKGWLISDFGNMQKYQDNTLLIDFLTKNTTKYNIHKKSNYFYSNLKTTVSIDDVKKEEEIVIANEGVNIRTLPAATSQIIGEANLGEVFLVMDKTKICAIEIDNKVRYASWYKIKKGNIVGWIYGFFCNVR